MHVERQPRQAGFTAGGEKFRAVAQHLPGQGFQTARLRRNAQAEYEKITALFVFCQIRWMSAVNSL